MKLRAFQWLLLFAFSALLIGGAVGCASTEPDNASVRPWNSSDGWQGGALGGMNYQHE
jgi:hypothetical protein